MHYLFAFLSGVVIEALYAIGVLFIAEKRKLIAAIISVVWGVALLIGVNEAFKNHTAAILWCIGLGIGTYVGMWLKEKFK